MSLWRLAPVATLLTVALLGGGVATGGPRGSEAGPTWVRGAHGKVARFDGRGEALDCGRGASLSTPGGLSIAFRVRLDALRPGAVLVRKPYSFEVALEPSGSAAGLVLHAWPGGRACSPPDGEAVAVRVPVGSWHHVVLTYDSRGARLGAWLDGRPAAEGSLAAACPGRSSYRLTSASYPLRLGGGHDGFRGALDDVALYGRVLAPTEIAALAEGREPPPTRLAGLWRFDTARGDRAPDGSGNGNGCRRRAPPRDDALPVLGGPVDAPVLVDDRLLTAWLASANERVFEGDRARGTPATASVAVALARNETEPFQVVLRPRRSLHAVHVTVSDLTNGEHRWPAEAFTVHRVGWIPVDPPSVLPAPHPLPAGDDVATEQRSRPGRHPDPLLTGPFDAPARRAVSLWISAKAPADLAPGLYRGSLRVASADQPPVEVELTARVWDFALPDRLRVNALAPFELHYGERDGFEAAAHDYAAHHVSLATLPPPIVTFDGDRAVLDTRDFDRAATLALDRLGMRDVYFPITGVYFLPRARDCATRAWYGRPFCDASGQLTPAFLAALSSYVGQMAAHLAERGWLARFRFAVLDEPASPAEYALVRQVAALVRQVAPGLPIALSHGPIPELQGSVDTWLLGHFQPRRMAEALARGERLEWYPNQLTLIDRPATNTRVLGWAMWHTHLTGLVLWATQYAWRGLDRELASARPVLTTHSGRPLWGSGTFLYPDEAWHPVPSVRWELVRDTLEDYEYLALQDDLCRALTASPPAAETDVALVREACAFLAEIPARLVPALESEDDAPRWRRLVWETEPAAYTEARTRVGTYLEALTALKARLTSEAPPAAGSPASPPSPAR